MVVAITLSTRFCCSAIRTIRSGGWDDRELAEISAFWPQHDLIVRSDEIHCDLIWTKLVVTGRWPCSTQNGPGAASP